MLTPFSRKLKQTNILLGGFLFLFAIFVVVWLLLARPVSQGKIEALLVEKVGAILVKKEKSWQPLFTYQVFAKIQNPNEKFFVEKVDYIFQIKDSKDKPLGQKEGTAKISQNEKKEIREEITTTTAGKNLTFEIKKIHWRRIR